MLDWTHDPAARSWVGGADAEDADFPVQNLPFGIFRRRGEGFRAGVAIGAFILDLEAVRAAGGLGEAAAVALGAACGTESLNALMGLGRGHWVALRHGLFAALREDGGERGRLEGCLVAQEDAEYALPAVIGDFTDFYTSIHHASLVGGMLRPEKPLLDNYKWLPVAYHGRSSSVGVSGQEIRRPAGQKRPRDGEAPGFGPSARLDFELELGFFVGPGNVRGVPIGVADAEAHVFGACVLNDWSARDIQAWEYQPLGPFLAKNFATTISPWVVTLEALAPFRVAFTRDAGDPAPLAHLAPGGSAFDVRLEVGLQSSVMREAGLEAAVLARSNYRYAYWTVSQMVAHHTSNGCNLRAGDLLGTGTLSGPGAGELGSLLEIARGGEAPVVLPSGERRGFVEDGDAVVMRAWCEKEGVRRIGFGRSEGRVLF